MPRQPSELSAIDPIYTRLGLITRSLHDTMAALRVGLDADPGTALAALRLHQPEGTSALLACQVLGQLERTEQDLLRLLADGSRKGRLARRGSAAQVCLDELLPGERAA